MRTWWSSSSLCGLCANRSAGLHVALQLVSDVCSHLFSHAVLIHCCVVILIGHNTSLPVRLSAPYRLITPKLKGAEKNRIGANVSRRYIKLKMEVN